MILKLSFGLLDRKLVISHYVQGMPAWDDGCWCAKYEMTFLLLPSARYCEMIIMRAIARCLSVCQCALCGFLPGYPKRVMHAYCLLHRKTGQKGLVLAD